MFSLLSVPHLEESIILPEHLRQLAELELVIVLLQGDANQLTPSVNAGL